ncbi:DUF4007 family protein [Prevotella denticola]|jgi:hypothetical protein
MAITYKFSGHESFPCKTLWLKKGYDFVRNENDFNSPNAVISLGVGKNMVSSIRYWLKAFGITDATGNLTEIGNYLFDEENGRDKYLEDLATLWLLHFNIVFLQEVTLYRWFFCGLQRERAQFDKDQIVTFVKLRMIEAGKQNLFNENTVKKDAAVLLQNYTLPRKAQSNEDYSSLLLDLDLIRQKSETKGYYFNVDGKRKVTKEVFMYGLLKLKEKNKDNTIAYETIHDQLGLLFCMNDTETITMLKSLSHIYSKQMTYSDVSGIRQVQFIDELNPTTVLEDYYAHI